jgi:hypothetical protein
MWGTNYGKNMEEALTHLVDIGTLHVSTDAMDET